MYKVNCQGLPLIMLGNLDDQILFLNPLPYYIKCGGCFDNVSVGEYFFGGGGIVSLFCDGGGGVSGGSAIVIPQ